MELSPRVGNGHWRCHCFIFVCPIITGNANGVCAISDGSRDSLPTPSAGHVYQNGRNQIAGRIVVPRPVVRAERRLELGEESDQVRPFQVSVHFAEVGTKLHHLD